MAHYLEWRSQDVQDVNKGLKCIFDERNKGLKGHSGPPLLEGVVVKTCQGEGLKYMLTRG